VDTKLKTMQKYNTHHQVLSVFNFKKLIKSDLDDGDFHSQYCSGLITLQVIIRWPRWRYHV